MKVLLLAITISSVSCAPAYRVVQKVRGVPQAETCPTLSMLLADFALTGVALGLSVMRYSSRDYVDAAAFAAAGMGLALADNISETTCR